MESKPPPPHPVHARHCPAEPLTLHSLERIPLRGATEVWGALQRPPITQLQGKAGLEEHSESEHTLTRRLLCTGAAFSGGVPSQSRAAPPGSQGLPCLGPHSTSPRAPPLRAGGRQLPAYLSGRSASAPCRHLCSLGRERLVCIGHAWPGPHPA